MRTININQLDEYLNELHHEIRDVKEAVRAILERLHMDIRLLKE